MVTLQKKKCLIQNYQHTPTSGTQIGRRRRESQRSDACSPMPQRDFMASTTKMERTSYVLKTENSTRTIRVSLYETLRRVGSYTTNPFFRTCSPVLGTNYVEFEQLSVSPKRGCGPRRLVVWSMRIPPPADHIYTYSSIPGMYNTRYNV